MEAITINSTEQIKDLTQQLEKDATWFEDKQIQLADEFPVISIHFTGDKFDSTITTGIMRSILCLQNAIYRSYSLYAYGKFTRLSFEERSALELCVRIDHGSSIIDIILKPVVQEIGKRVKKMTNKQLLASIAIVVVLGAGYFPLNKYIDSQVKIKELEIRYKHEENVQKIVTESIIDTIHAQNEFIRELAKQDFETLKICGSSYTPAELKEIARGSRTFYPLVSVPYSGAFIITDIHIQEDALFIDVQKEDGTTIKYVNIIKSMISSDDYNWLKDSAEHKPVKMTVIATEKNGEIIAAYLQNFEKQSTP